MSGEYYVLEEISDNSDTENDTSFPQNHQNFKTNSNPLKAHEGSRLLDIEQQLEHAENRCTCLKSQLDYMKQLYGVKKSEFSTPKVSSARISTTKIALLKKHYENEINKHMVKAGDGVKTSRTTQTNLLEGTVTNDPTFVINNPATIATTMTRHMPVNIKCDRVCKTKGQKRTEKLIVNLAKTPSEKLYPSTKTSKRSTKLTHPNSKNIRKRKGQMSHHALRNQRVAVPKISDLSAHKLIEIYHNASIKGSDSDESNANKKSKHKVAKEARRIAPIDVPPLKINLKDQGEVNIRKSNRISCVELAQSQGDQNKRIISPNVNSVSSKNYTLPTIASRMKQVAKNYLSTYNFKAIPFCVALATTPSHNIGINIQQVMNIIKTRQPIQGLSPTLTHNIVLAASRLNYTPLGTLISSITSKAEYGVGKHECPLSKTVMNYHQLEEMAKTIPDIADHEGDEPIFEPEPQIECNTIIGPSGEVQVRNQKRVLWTANSEHTTCTCIPQQGLELHQIASKYQTTYPVYTDLQLSNMSSKVTMKRGLSKTLKSSTTGIRHTANNNMNKCKTVPEPVTVKCVDEPTPLQGKERNLKEVLTNLHNDFESLNKKYEEFAARITEEGSGNEECKEQLAKLEQELNNKEEEITMVMSLYKEVIALKQQVKALKSQSSKPLISIRENVSKFKDYNNPRAAFHLTKLLKQIQHYQMHYKNKG